MCYLDYCSGRTTVRDWTLDFFPGEVYKGLHTEGVYEKRGDRNDQQPTAHQRHRYQPSNHPAFIPAADQSIVRESSLSCEVRPWERKEEKKTQETKRDKRCGCWSNV